jgi:hypothetical protein
MATTNTRKRTLKRKPAAAKKTAPKKTPAKTKAPAKKTPAKKTASKKTPAKTRHTVKRDRALTALDLDKARPLQLDLDATPIFDLATAELTGDWKHDSELLNRSVSAFDQMNYIRVFIIGRLCCKAFAGEIPMHGADFMNAFMKENGLDRSTLTTYQQFFRHYAGRPEMVQELVDNRVAWRRTRLIMPTKTDDGFLKAHKILLNKTDDGFLKAHKILLKAKSYEEVVEKVDKLRASMEGEKDPTKKTEAKESGSSGDGGDGEDNEDALGEDKTGKEKDNKEHKPETEQVSGAEDVLAAYR